MCELFTKKVDVIQSLNLYVLKNHPVSLWLEHDFYVSNLKQMKIIYKKFNSHMSTMCDEDRIDLEMCYTIKYYNEKKKGQK